MILPANVTQKVWAAKTPDPDDLFADMFCETQDQTLESCGESCCEMKPCMKCSGETYTEGCMAGFTGTCAKCPKTSSCSAGQMQSCGEGILSECTACSNAPKNAHYVGSAMSADCPWECDDDHTLRDGKCIPTTCGTWTGACDAASTIPLASDTLCSGFCTSTSCCSPKATCGAYLGASSESSSATCALVKEATGDGKVWAPLEATEGATLYCKGTESDDSSCQKACCAEQSCKTCSGKFYTDGCQAGTVGTCAACPTSTSCTAGEYQTCGDGVLSKCQKCSNAPANSVYTEGALSGDCPWSCEAGYVKAGASCVATCALYSCDASSSIPFKPSTLCNGTCTTETCCNSKATCGASSEPAVNLHQPSVPWSKRRPATGKSGPRLRQLQGPHCIVRARRAMIAPVRKRAVQSNHARHAVGSFTLMAAKQALSVAARLARRTPLAQRGNIRSVVMAC